MNLNNSKRICTMFALISMMVVMFVLASTETKAAPVYEKTNIKSQMMVGQTELYTYVSWTLDGVRGRFEIKEDSVVTSSNEAVLKTSVYESEGATYSTCYVLRVEAIAEGTATLSFNYGETTVDFDVQVAGISSAVIEAFPTDKTIDKGSGFALEHMYKVTCGSFSGSFWLEECEVTSSNPGVVTVSKSGSTLTSIYLKGVGAGTATITITVTKEGLQGLSRSFNVTVVEGPVAPIPYIESQVKKGGYSFSFRIEIGFKVMPGHIEYEIYRSTSKNKGYKKIGSVTLEEDVGLKGYYSIGGTGMAYEEGKLYGYDEYNTSGKALKPNKQYYFKIRARYMDSYNSNEWSDFSKPQGYWTAPAPIKDKKVKFNMKTRKATVPKVKNIAGYIYTVFSAERQGYNIFGQPVYYSQELTRTTKKRIFTVAKLKYGMKPLGVRDVVPYAKHGKYYYAHGYDIVKKVSKYNDWDSGKFVGK